MITVCNPCATQSFKTFQLHLQDQFEKIATQRPDAFAHCQADAKKTICQLSLRVNPQRQSCEALAGHYLSLGRQCCSPPGQQHQLLREPGELRGS